jgi:hypothetical protein
LPGETPILPTFLNRRIAQVVLGLIALTSMGLCIGFEIARQESNGSAASLTQSYSRWDAYMRQAAPRAGVFLKFVGFEGNWRGYVANIYYRAVYVLYPKPVLVADPSVVVNNENQLVDTNSYPNDRRLLNHGVGAVLTIVFDPATNSPVPAEPRWVGEQSQEKPR